MRLGRNKPRIWKPTLDFERYLTNATGWQPRVTVDRALSGDMMVRTTAIIPGPARPLGQRWESKSIHLLHDPAGNDDVGDCTCAGMVKLDVSWWDDAQQLVDLGPPGVTAGGANGMKNAALGLYSRATGYNPSDPSTDQGAELTQILDYVKANGVYADGSGKIAGYVAVDATKPDQIAKAIDTVGGLYTGATVYEPWCQNPLEGGVWDVLPDDAQVAGGHCVTWFDYNEQGVIFNTWGLFMTLTWAAAAKYWGKAAGGEVYAVFSPDWLNAATKESPSGFNAQQLAADIAAGF
jgi:hypothetical protein